MIQAWGKPRFRSSVAFLFRWRNLIIRNISVLIIQSKCKSPLSHARLEARACCAQRAIRHWPCSHPPSLRPPPPSPPSSWCPLHSLHPGRRRCRRRHTLSSAAPHLLLVPRTLASLLSLLFHSRDEEDWSNRSAGASSKLPVSQGISGVSCRSLCLSFPLRKSRDRPR